MKPWKDSAMASTSFCDNDPDSEADIGDLFLNDETDDHDGGDSEGWPDSDEDSYDLHSSQQANETAKRLSEWLCSPRHGLEVVLKRLADPEVSLEQEVNLATKIYSHINSAARAGSRANIDIVHNINFKRALVHSLNFEAG